MTPRNDADRPSGTDRPAGETADTQGKPGDASATRPAEPTDDLVTTSHRWRLGGREVDCTATTGRLVLRTEEHSDETFDGHKPKAELFITAYTMDSADPTGRPVTFAFNGGPGSSSAWLHLGLLGPRRAVAGDVDALAPPPYGLTDNEQSLLEVSDLVFIDPISTGYSRVTTGEKPKQYHGFTGDIESIGELIRLWVSRNGRWLSPKYVCGESYGTVRAAALARHLQERYGMNLNGIMLISSVLDLGTIDFHPGNDLPYPLFLPTYAAIANYHGRHPERPLAEVVAQAEQYAERQYPFVLAQGDRLPDEQRAEALTTLAELTGLSRDYLDRVDLRVEHIRFFTELLRDRKRTVGRLDGRFSGWDPDYGSEKFAADPSMEAIIGPFTAATNHYLRAELGYANDLPYEMLSSRVLPWSYREFEGQHVTVCDRLAAAMRGNPYLRVYLASGYYDGATPYLATDYTLAHLQIPAELRANIEVHYFEAGHMMYLHEPSRRAQSAQLRAFVTT
jgi:carboxypeptidase C (cathepsin A)